MRQKDHINSAQMSEIFQRDAPHQYRKDFRALNIQNMKAKEEEIRSRMAPQEQTQPFKLKQF
jgi:hypothetical protein